MLGTNGGGFFNVNSAHPFENPNGFTNFFEMLMVLINPGALVFMYGKMVGSRRQALAVLRRCSSCSSGRVVPRADLVRQRAGPRLAGLDPEPLALRQPRTASPASRRRSRWGRSPRRRRSRCSGTNGGGFFNVNSAHPFENPNGFTNFYEMLHGAAHPRGPCLHLRQDGRLAPPGDAVFAAMFVMFFGAVCRLRGRGARLAGPARRRTPHRRHRRTDRRQHGGQGAALRHRRLGAVRRRHHRHLVRRGQQLARVLHRARRRRPVRQPVGQRGDLRRRRHRPVLDPALRPARGLPRRPDGRANAGVPRQEDRGQGDQARRARAC